MGQQLYIIRTDSGHIKIGLSQNPRDRLRGMQMGNPHRLEYLETFDCDGFSPKALERYTHHILQKHRAEGEWFDIDLSAAESAVDEAKIALRAGKSTAKDRGVPITFHMPDDVRHQLKGLAYERRTAVHNLGAEAFNGLFAKYGKPEIAPVNRKEGQ